MGADYGLTALRGECERVRAATKGSRNNALNESSFRMGQIVAAGRLNEAAAADALTAAGMFIGLPVAEVKETVRSGLLGGKRSGAREIEELTTEQGTVTFLDATDDQDDWTGSSTPTNVPRAAETILDVPAIKLQLQCAEEIGMSATEWTWENKHGKWIPAGGLTLLAGREGLGKSTWGYMLAAQLSRGILPGDVKRTGVIVVADEDSWEATIVPRLRASEADLKRVFRVDAGQYGHLTLPNDVKELDRLVTEYEIGMILLDPLLGALNGKLDSHKDAEVRQALQPLSEMAFRHRLSVLGIAHVNKSGSTDLVNAVMGSRAFTAVARCVLVCVDVNGRRLFGQEKINVGPRIEVSIPYILETINVGHDARLNKSIESSRVLTEDALAGRPGAHVAEGAAVTKRKEDSALTMRKWLIERGGEVDANAAVEHWMTQLAKSPATIQRLRANAGIDTKPIQVNGRKTYVWYIRDTTPPVYEARLGDDDE